MKENIGKRYSHTVFVTRDDWAVLRLSEKVSARMLHLVACMSTFPSCHVLSGMIDMHMRHSDLMVKRVKLNSTSSSSLPSLRLNPSHNSGCWSKENSYELCVDFVGSFSISMASKILRGSSRFAKTQAHNAKPLHSILSHQLYIASTIWKCASQLSSCSSPN